MRYDTVEGRQQFIVDVFYKLVSNEQKSSLIHTRNANIGSLGYNKYPYHKMLFTCLNAIDLTPISNSINYPHIESLSAFGFNVNYHHLQFFPSSVLVNSAGFESSQVAFIFQIYVKFIR